MEFSNLRRNILDLLGDQWIQSKKIKAFKKKLIFEAFADIPAKNLEDAIEALKDDEFLEMTPDNDRMILTQKGLAQIEVHPVKPEHLSAFEIKK
jgi:predicted transcriptional regulator